MASDFLGAILAICVSGILGLLGNQALESAGIKMPPLVTCLLAAIVLTSLAPRAATKLAWPSATAPPTWPSSSSRWSARSSST